MFIANYDFLLSICYILGTVLGNYVGASNPDNK